MFSYNNITYKKEGVRQVGGAFFVALSIVSVCSVVGRPSDAVAAGDSQPKPRILIVPGHEPDYGGAEFGKLRERDLAVELGNDLAEFLESEGGYESFVTRDTDSWDPVFSDYFKNGWQGIIDWKKKAKKELSHLISIGSTTKMVPTIIHNDVETDVGLRLYGITKWANENNIDLMLHIHFNDDPVRSRRKPGTFSGFAIYVPAEQYSNSMEAHSIARSVFKQLSQYNPVSNLPQESEGIIDDPDLIALGANNTAQAASMLIEYEYLYAPKFTDPKVRAAAIKELAYETYLGLQDFFGKKTNIIPGSHGSSLLPYLWSAPVTSTSSAMGIFALQTALAAAGAYPPANKTKSDCPRSGLFGTCTKTALKEYQKDRDISGEEDVAGQQTINALHFNF